MISIKFEILFEVTIEHEYFADGIAREVDVKPTDETINRLIDYGLLFRKTPKGFLVLYEKDVNTPLEPPLRPLLRDEMFRFEVYTNDPWFTNYTQLPLGHSSPDIFYFNNLTENIISSKKLLNHGEHVNSNNIVQLSSHIYHLLKSIPATTALLEIFDLQGNVALSKTLHTKELNGSNILDEQIDFLPLGNGRFNIHIDSLLETELYVDSNLSGKGLFGIIEIHKSMQVPANYAFADINGTVTNPQTSYSLLFGHRKSTWQYYIILRDIESDTGISINYTDPVAGEEPYPTGVIFNTGVPNAGLVDTYGSGKVLLFESNKELPFYETPKKNIKLNRPEETENGDGDGDGEATETLLKHLPNASLTAVKPNEDNSKVFSEIYVFI